MRDLTLTIVAYNNFEDLKNAIYSIEKFTSKKLDKKIFIVDNSCIQDDNENLIDFKDYISRFNDVEYIKSNDNIGFGKGHNFVLNRIDSKYHAIVNPDIILEEDALSKIIDYLEKNDDVGMVIPRITDINGTRQEVYRLEPTIFDMFIRMFCKNHFKKRQSRHTMSDKDYKKSFQVPFGQGSFLVIRSELFKSLNGFDDNFFMYMEDADLCKRVNQISKLMYFPDATVIHKWEKGSHKNKELFKHHINSMKYYFKKWGYRLF